jgi:predicted RNase H-like HicB family nuclease
MKTFVIVIERAGENFSAYAPEVPGCVATGSTEKEAEANMRSALDLHLKGMEEDGLLAGSHDMAVRRIRVAPR